MIMKRVVFFLTAAIISLSSLAFAQNFKGRVQEATIATPQNKLTIGETLVYSVEWLGISAGKIILSVNGTEKIDGNECYHVTAKALPNKFFRMFHDVEYRVDSFIDTKGLFSRRFEKVKRLNNVYTCLVIEFNPEKNEAKYKFDCAKAPADTNESASLRKKRATNKNTIVKIPTGTQDVLSTLYYFRLLDIKKGEAYPVNVSYDRQNWAFKINVGEPYLRDFHKKGSFCLFQISPNSDLINSITGKRGITIYLTADSFRKPALFTMNTKIGFLRGILQDLAK